MMLAAILLWISGGISLADTLIVLVMSFLVFNQIKAFGMGVSILRMAAPAFPAVKNSVFPLHVPC